MPRLLPLLALAPCAALAAKNLLRNPSFEDSTQELDPWTSDAPGGFVGLNFPEKGTEAQDGDNFLWLVGYGAPYQVRQQVLGVKAGEVYNISYYAYGWGNVAASGSDPGNADELVGWQVTLGSASQTANLTTVYNGSNLDPSLWPHWVHIFNATVDDPYLSFIEQNNTNLYLDHTSATCLSCPASDDTGAIVGGVIGGIAGVGLLLLAGMYFYLRVLRPRRLQRQQQPYDMAHAQGRWMSPMSRTSEGQPSSTGHVPEIMPSSTPNPTQAMWRRGDHGSDIGAAPMR